uniref:Uncharacterized protein n=1 Tax=Anopheles dirus TaxID=7168 RepID=A0A182NQW4_9DIPT
MLRSLVFAGALSIWWSSALAMECPLCVGVDECNTNQTIPKFACTGAIANQTVVLLSTFYKNLTEYTGTNTQYSCVEVNFRPVGALNDTFAVKGCSSGSRSVCGQPTYDFNGNLTCNSYYGSTGNNLDRRSFTSVLLSMAVIIGTFVIAS